MSRERAPNAWQRFSARHLWDYNRAARWYWVAMVAAGGFALGAALLQLAWLPPDALLQVAAGLACTVLAALLPVAVPGVRVSFVVGELFIFVLLLLHGMPAAVVAAAAEGITGSMRTTPRWSSRIATPALAAVAMTLIGGAFEGSLGWLRSQPEHSSTLLLSTTLVLGVGYGLLNSVLLSAVDVFKRGGLGPVQVWVGRFGWVTVVHAACAAISTLVYLTIDRFGLPVLAAVLPIVVALLVALRLYFRVVELNERVQNARTETAEQLAEQASAHLAELRRSEQRFHRAFSHASIGMALVDTDGRTVQANVALAALLGREAEALIGGRLAEHLAADDGQRLQAASAEVRDGRTMVFTLENLRGQRHGGAAVWVSVSGSMFADGSEPGDVERCLILQVQDVTARLQAETQLQHVAWHDDLTGLPNRGRFMGALAEACAQCVQGSERFALMFMDFDRFKLINDGLGHNVGDELLRNVTARILAQVRPGDMVARLGGDEFAVLMRGLVDELPAVHLAEKLQAVLREPIQVHGHELTTSASIGIRLAGGSLSDPTELLRDADTAMYRAKAGGKARWSLFDTTMHARVSEQLMLEGELRRAIAADQIEVMFQPLYSLHDARLIGFEALARWQHPTRGAISPSRFVPLAEEAGLVTQLTQRVLAKACSGLAAMVGRSAEPLRINVNITALDLCQRGFADQVARLLNQHGLKASQLSLELPEGMLMARLDGVVDTMHALRTLGVGLCVDDFGTGYSSLALLSSLPITSLKIDARFVQQLTPERDSVAIVRAIIQIGEALGKTVIAEGIEHATQLRQLLDLGCVQGQGFLLSHPERSDDLERLLGGSEALRQPSLPGSGTLQ